MLAAACARSTRTSDLRHYAALHNPVNFVGRSLTAGLHGRTISQSSTIAKLLPLIGGRVGLFRPDTPDATESSYEAYLLRLLVSVFDHILVVSVESCSSNQSDDPERRASNQCVS